MTGPARLCFNTRNSCFTTAAMLLSITALLTSQAAAAEPAEPTSTMQKVRISDDGQHFVLAESGQRFIPWGFNYLGQFGALVEDSWDSDWQRVERDFRNMQQLGCNVVRHHLQFSTYMTGPEEFDDAQLERLKKLLDLGRETGVYLDLTGLSLYRLDKIPAWYEALSEGERWKVQARWWNKIAETCAGHPAVFCYCLMNEPVLGSKSKEGEPRWVGGELGGFYFVQKISEDAAGRTSIEIASAWSEKLTTAIRNADPKTPITVGVIPWAQIWPGAKPVFYSPEAAKYFDFVSVHAYPEKDKVDRALHALSVYDIGKPLVIEETFPLNCSMEDMDEFIEKSKSHADGWISHYFGYTIEEHRAGAEPHGTAPDAPFQVTVADFLEFWRDTGKTIAQTSATEPASADEAKPTRTEPDQQPKKKSTPPTASSSSNAKSSNIRSTTALQPPANLIVRGSVEQIHVIHARPEAKVTVRTPDGSDTTASTDHLGGLVLRDLTPGDGYSVTIDGSGRDAQDVRVLRRDEHPSEQFYASQTLEPTRGYIQSRDGTLLSYRVVLPDAAVHGPGPYDLIITYSGYQPSLETRDGHQNRPFEQFSSLGYAVAGVNMRGSGGSGGAFDFMEPLTWLDGYDMIEAFSAQTWVDDVALGDQSWPGLTQLFVASTQPPSLDAIVAGSVVGDFYRDVFYPGGIQNVGFGHIWAAGRDVENAWPSRRSEVNALTEVDPVFAANQALRGQNVSLLETVKQHPYHDAYWRARTADVAKIKVPTLQINSWQDPQCGGRPAILSEQFSRDTPVRLVGVNGFHQYYSGAVWDEIVSFLDIYLGGHPQEKIAQYESQNRFVVLLESDEHGVPRGRFTLPSFASAGSGQRFTFGVQLLPDDAAASSSTSSFTYDPSKPGSWTKQLQDQVSFTSEPLEQQTVMAGSGSVDLWIATIGAADVDLQATISEVRPDGQEMLIQSGWLRASHRALDEAASTSLRPHHLHTTSTVAKLVEGQLTPLRIELFPFAHVFRAGSRVRVTISGPGGGSNAWPWAFDALPGPAEVQIAHTPNHPSSITLPTVTPTDLTLPATHPNQVWLQPLRPTK